METYKLLGIKVNSIEPEEVYRKILYLSELNRPCRVILLDTHLLMKAKFNFELRNVINTSDLVIPISSGIRSGLKFLNIKIKKVYNYYNFLISLLLHFSENNKFIYIVGGKKKYVTKVSENLKASFPGIRLVGVFHGQYKKNFEDNLITAIRKACPALIMVGINKIKDLKWIEKEQPKFKSGVFIGVGDFVNIVAGKGASPSEKAVQSGLYTVKSIFKNPFQVRRLVMYITYINLLIFSKLFGNKSST
jgi:N-acetylglucosaminyldiphosphoundecaprenol N-acetyl-beta-D-mannosaminyltransferase